MTGSPTAARHEPALVLHAPVDEAFVRGFLVPALGGDAALQVLDVAGASPAELERAIRASGVAIAVITPAFVADPWTRLSELLASSAAIASERDVLPLVLEDCELPLHLEAMVRLDFRRRGDWEREIERLRRRLARPAPAAVALPCPYPGMRPFRAGDVAHFHGRGAEIDEVVGLLESGQRELYVIGPSGCGKSSLIAAGVLPRLLPDGGAIVLRPGDAPSLRLAEALGAAEASEAAIAARLATRPPGADPRLVLFVDQLEELFTQASAAEQARFAAGLRVVRDDPRCFLLLAVRADFFAELLESELWHGGARRHVDLLPLRGAALREAIERPARALEVYFEPGLIDRLLSDAAGEPGVLPLLQETLVQLWDQRRHRLLTRAAYEAMGDGGRSGLAVAISSRAARCLEEMAPSARVIARRILLRMVSFGEGRPNTRRRQTRMALAAGEPAAALDEVLERLVSARLVTKDDGERPGDDRVELCHEVLVTAWPAFSEWVEARRADEQRRRQIQASAEDWVARGRGASGLLDRDELAAAVAWRETDAARELGESPEVTALIGASQRALGRERRRRLGWAAGLGAGVLILAAVAVIARLQNQAAEAERGKATRLQGVQYLETGRQLLVGGHPQQAIPYLVTARERGGDGPALRRLFHAATRTRMALALTHGDAVTSSGWNDDGTRIVTGSRDRTVQVWNAATGEPIGPPLVHPAQVEYAVMMPGGRRVIASSYQTVWIWDLAASPPSRIDIRHDAPIGALGVSDDGERFATGAGTTARVWSASSGAPVSPPVEHEGFVTSVDLTRDGSRVVSTDSWSHAAKLWDTATAAPILLEAPHRPKGAVFSPDGTGIAAAVESAVHVWDAVTGKQLFDPIAHPGEVHHLRFTPNGLLIATATDRGSVQLWGAKNGQPVFSSALQHPQPLWRIDLSRDGSRLLAACLDKSIHIWDVSSFLPSAPPIDLEAGAADVAFSPDGKRLVTAGPDGVARVWDTSPMASRLVEVKGAFDSVSDGGYSPDGGWIAAIRSGTLRIWTASGMARGAVPVGSAAEWIVFAPGRTRLAVITGMDRVQIWDYESEEMVVAPEGIGRRSPRPAEVPSLGFSPDGRRFASTVLADESTARIWDADTGRPLTPPLVHAQRIMTTRFSPGGRLVVTASLDGTARVWDAATGEAAGPPLPHPGEHGVTSAMFSPDGARIATVSGQVVRLWDTATYLPAGSLVGHADSITSAVFSMDGTRIVTSGDDRTVRIWEVASGRPLTTPLEHAEQVRRAVFSSDGARVVTSGSGSAQVWDAATGKPMTPPLPHAGLVHRAELSPDGASLLTIAEDGVRVWAVGRDARTLEEWRAIAATGAFPELARSLGLAAQP